MKFTCVAPQMIIFWKLFGSICLIQQFIFAMDVFIVNNSAAQRGAALIMIGSELLITIRLFCVNHKLQFDIFETIITEYSYFLFVLFELIRIISILNHNTFELIITSCQLLSSNYSFFDVIQIIISIISNIFLFLNLRILSQSRVRQILMRFSTGITHLGLKSMHKEPGGSVSDARRPTALQLQREDRTTRIIYRGKGYVIGLETRSSGEPIDRPYRIGKPIEDDEVYWLPAKNYKLLGQAVASAEDFARTLD